MRCVLRAVCRVLCVRDRCMLALGVAAPSCSGGCCGRRDAGRRVQVVTEAAQPLARYYRHISVGAWPFSTRDHGWPISDCTSEVRPPSTPPPPPACSVTHRKRTLRVSRGSPCCDPRCRACGVGWVNPPASRSARADVPATALAMLA